MRRLCVIGQRSVGKERNKGQRLETHSDCPSCRTRASYRLKSSSLHSRDLLNKPLPFRPSNKARPALTCNVLEELHLASVSSLLPFGYRCLCSLARDLGRRITLQWDLGGGGIIRQIYTLIAERLLMDDRRYTDIRMKKPERKVELRAGWPS
jgi:hypothetical protein